VLVNPAAGKGKGLEVYDNDVAPVFACLGNSVVGLCTLNQVDP
jgi:hypothetical protein